MTFKKLSQSLLLLIALGVMLITLVSHVAAQTATLSYQTRITINEMIQSDLQTPGSSVTINQSSALIYNDGTASNGLSSNPAYGPMADELAALLNTNDTVVITSAGANIIQNGNTSPLDISPTTVGTSTGGTASGTAHIVGTLDSANNQYDTFIPNLVGYQAPIDLYVVYGPNLQQRTPTTSFDRSSCSTPDLLDFCFDVSGIYRDDYFSIYQDLPNTVRDIKLIGPYQFSILAGTDTLATFEQRWYYIIYDWFYTRPDGSRSQTFTDQASCQQQASLVTTGATCESFLGTPIRHSHYFDDKNACFTEAIAVSGNSSALCYSTQVRNIQITFDTPIAAIDGQFPNPPTTTLVGQTSAFLKGTIDTKGVPAPIYVEVFGVPRYVLDAQGNPETNANGFKIESRINNTTFQQPYGSTYQKINLSLASDPNIHALTTQNTTNPLMTNPGEPQSFTIAFNNSQTNATITFPETLKKDYIYYYRVYNPDYIPNGESRNIFEIKPTTSIDAREGFTYSQGWFTTADFTTESGGEVLGGVIKQINLLGGDLDPLVNDIEGDPSILFNPLDIVKVDSIPGLVERIFQGFRLVIGPFAAVLIVYLAFLFITSARVPEQRAQAEVTLKYVAIGLGVLVFAYILGLGVQSVVECLATGVCR